MSTNKKYGTLEQAKLSLAIKTGLFAYEESGVVMVCTSDDNAVMVQVGHVVNGGFLINSELAQNADEIHQKLTRYFEGGLHGGITMLVLSLCEDGSYHVYGDDTDNDCAPVEISKPTLPELLSAITAEDYVEVDLGKGNGITKKTIEFITRITYESDDDALICEESARDNLYAAIENERVNGTLTPDNISALGLSVDVIGK